MTEPTPTPFPASSPAPWHGYSGQAADPYAVPGAYAAPDPAPEPAAPRPPRRVLRAVLRWTSAVVVFSALAGGVGYALTLPDRTELPGLRTESDGRWDFPELKRPALAAGAQAPLAEDNAAKAHHVDLRALRLPAPAGARPDPALAGRDGWVSGAAFLEEYGKDSRTALRQSLVDESCRHITARGWTMPDGTHARIYLLQFNTGALADRFHSEMLESAGGGADTPGADLAESPSSHLDESWPSEAGAAGTDLYVYDESAPRGGRHARHAYIVAGDVVALVVHSRKGTAAKVPFQQTVILQDQLLG